MKTGIPAVSVEPAGLPDELAHDQDDPTETQPWPLLTLWLPTNDDPDRPRMTLSTVTEDGRADARTVLLTAWDGSGFSFHTDAASRKVAQIAAHPDVALTLLWDGFSRQLVVQGRAEVAPAAEVAAAYRSRSHFLQQLAHENTPAFAQLSLARRRELWAQVAAAHPDGFDQPESWTGYLVRPTRVTFWATGVDTASRRVEFRRTATGWDRFLLPG